MKSFRLIAGVVLTLLLAGLASNNLTKDSCKPNCCIEQTDCCPE